MKIFIVFAAVVTMACANAVGRSGWGSGSGHNTPSIDLELAAAAAAAGAGSAAANQALIETVSGNSEGPAQLASLNGLLTVVQQGEDLSQVQVADKPSGATSTINAANVSNEAIVQDTLEASLIGANSASVQNSANTDASGEGAIASEASSLNVVESGSGWRSS